MVKAADLRVDLNIAVPTLILISIGLVMVASASVVLPKGASSSILVFFIKQGIAAILGFGLGFAMLFVSTAQWYRWAPLLISAGLILLVLVLVPGIGSVVNGSRRWIRAGPLVLQVSEFVKFFVMVYLAYYCHRSHQFLSKDWHGLLKPVGVLLLVTLLLLLEPDFGTASVIFLAALGMLFMAGVQLRWFALLVLMAGIAMALLVVYSPYRLARLMSFLDPWADPYQSGYQLTQSLIAFGRGGWFGVGLGNSIQKLFYLPESHTDFVLAIIAEETGLVGVFCLIALYLWLIVHGLGVAKRAMLQSRLFAGYLAFGVVFLIALQFLINVSVNIGLLPTKGLTLPFMSYGGSSLLANCLLVGVLLRISLENQYEAERDS